ncbi:MAG: helix-turn-helix domain-containing protein [Flavobacteriaceae bacterium]
MTPFGARIREMRDERGITLQDMAAALEVSPAYLSALEHGKRGRPNWFLLQRIIAYFNVIWDEAEALQRLALMSHPRVVVDTSGLSPEATELANRLAVDIGRLRGSDIEELLSRLKTMTGGRRGDGEDLKG